MIYTVSVEATNFRKEVKVLADREEDAQKRAVDLLRRVGERVPHEARGRIVAVEEGKK